MNAIKRGIVTLILLYCVSFAFAAINEEKADANETTHLGEYTFTVAKDFGGNIITRYVYDTITFRELPLWIQIAEISGILVAVLLLLLKKFILLQFRVLRSRAQLPAHLPASPHTLNQNSVEF